MTTNDNNPTPDTDEANASLGSGSEGTINNNFTGRTWAEEDLSFDVNIPLYHHHNVVILRRPRELDHPDLPHLAKIYTSLENAITDATGTPFTKAGAISYLSTHTRMLTQPLLYSTLQTQHYIGNTITRASYYHDSFDSKTLFIMTPYLWDRCLGARLHRLVDQTYLTYQNLLLVNIWEPSCTDQYSTFPLASYWDVSTHEALTIGMLHNLDTISIPEYNLGIKTILNLLYYLIITAGMSREGWHDDHYISQNVVKTYFWSPLGYKEKHKVFLDDTKIR